jgi:hypothetical protein
VDALMLGSSECRESGETAAGTDPCAHRSASVSSL